MADQIKLELNHHEIRIIIMSIQINLEDLKAAKKEYYNLLNKEGRQSTDEIINAAESSLKKFQDIIGDYTPLPSFEEGDEKLFINDK